MSSNVPELCRRCHRNQDSSIVKGCGFCVDLSFLEHNLCDLVRGKVDPSKTFECHAFRPLLSLVRDEGQAPVTKLGEGRKKKMGRPLTKQQWFENYVAQELESNPEALSFQTKYHLCLVTLQRKKAFSESNQHINRFLDIFDEAEKQFEKTNIRLLWLGVDHLHIFIDTSPSNSIDDIVRYLWNASEKGILNLDIPNKENRLWNAEFFLETVG